MKRSNAQGNDLTRLLSRSGNRWSTDGQLSTEHSEMCLQAYAERPCLTSALPTIIFPYQNENVLHARCASQPRAPTRIRIRPRVM